MIVEVKQGKLEGIKEKSVLTGCDFYSYLGIPYAKPPIGDLRFMPPIPVDKWNGIYEAKKEASACYQHDFAKNNEVIGSEDCLYLNVYTPAAPSDIKIPKAVMVYIHGGGFFTGSSSRMMCSADYLINYDIILVTLNYRLHSLGFLNMGTANCPGNCGLKDQLQALKWIKENIRQFGGDPDNVTLFGTSAGSSSVHWHSLSPASKGFFQKTIMHSGLSTTAWGFIDNPTEMGFKLGRLLGFEGNDPETLVEFLKKQPVKNLLEASFKLGVQKRKECVGIAFPIPFGPSIESIKENAFITDLPQNLCKIVPPVPTISGICDNEGRTIIFVLMDSFQEIIKDIPSVIKNNFKFKESHLLEIANEVKKFYSGTGSNTELSINDFINLYSDIYFRNFYSTLDYIANSSVPLYVYEFGFNGDLNFSKRVIIEPFKHLFTEGASHADDISYTFFSRSIGNYKFKEPETSVIKNMCTLLTNFAKTGNPNGETIKVEWKPYKPDEPHYLQIKQDLKLVDGRILEKGTAFWNKLEERFK